MTTGGRGGVWVLVVALLSALAWAGVGDGTWRAKVPEKARARENPLAADPTAARAGAKLFHEHCASCHGSDAAGKDKKPPLTSERVQAATAGELEWLLKNGSMKNGMPSWSKLPEPQRWQIVAYLKTLK
jgi:mono/diheme cytochrome c family protein